MDEANWKIEIESLSERSTGHLRVKFFLRGRLVPGGLISTKKLDQPQERRRLAEMAAPAFGVSSEAVLAELEQAHVAFLKESMDPRTLRKLVTRAGGEVVSETDD